MGIIPKTDYGRGIGIDVLGYLKEPRKYDPKPDDISSLLINAEGKLKVISGSEEFVLPYENLPGVKENLGSAAGLYENWNQLLDKADARSFERRIQIANEQVQSLKEHLEPGKQAYESFKENDAAATNLYEQAREYQFSGKVREAGEMFPKAIGHAENAIEALNFLLERYNDAPLEMKRNHLQKGLKEMKHDYDRIKPVLNRSRIEVVGVDDTNIPVKRL